MSKIVRESLIQEGYGTGFSFTGGAIKGLGGTSRGGFGGAGNLGGPNMMYTYEIKPLNHTLEQLPTVTSDQTEQIQIGSKIRGEVVRSNATPTKKRITGIVHKIEKTDDNSIKYYVVQDEATQLHVKIDPLTANLITHEPVEYYQDATDNVPSKRKEKLKDVTKNNKLVRESIYEMI